VITGPGLACLVAAAMYEGGGAGMIVCGGMGDGRGLSGMEARLALYHSPWE